MTKNNTLMANAWLEDLYGRVEVIIFPKTFERCRGILDGEPVVAVNAIAEFGDDRSVRLLANEITLMEDVRSSMPAPTRIKVLAEEENDAKQRIWRIMQGPAGRQPQDLQNDELRLYARDQEGNVHAVAKLTVRANQRLLQALRREFGDQNVKEERIKVQ